MHKPNITDLRWLLVSMGLVMVLHVPHQAIWISVFIAVFGIWRYLIERNSWKLPRLALLLTLTILAGLGIALTYRGLFGRDASTALLAIMLSLKLMETRTPRDYMLVIFSGFLLTITAFLFSQTLLVGAFVLLPVLGLTATLNGISHPNGDFNWRIAAINLPDQHFNRSDSNIQTRDHHRRTAYPRRYHPSGNRGTGKGNRVSCFR